MPLFRLFLLATACLPIDWPARPFGLSPRGCALLTAFAVLVPLAAAFALRMWAVRTLDRAPDRRAEVLQGYGRLRVALFVLNLVAAVLAVLWLGWGATVWETLTVERAGHRVLAPFAELLVPLPYFLILFGRWLIDYDAERALHRLASGSRSETRFWSRAGYVLHHLRQLAFLILLPIGLLVTQQSLIRFAPEVAAHPGFRLASFACLPILILFLPLLVKPLLGLRSLPPGPTRNRIETLARRLHFRYTDLLLWPTHGSVMNAMIIGLIPRIRYVIFTDRILEDLPPDELDAVFGHEVGHARHGHVGFYALFVILSMTVLAAFSILAGQFLDDAAKLDPATWYIRFAEENAGWLAVVPVAATVFYIFAVFGFLSRRCERQADIFGCRAVSCSDPHCTGHDENTCYPERGSGLCPTGIRTFARALERVYLLSGSDHPTAGPYTLADRVRAVYGLLRAWQHSTIPRRVGFLLSLIGDRSRERRFQRRLLALRWGLALGLLAILMVLGEQVSWQTLLAAL